MGMRLFDRSLVGDLIDLLMLLYLEKCQGGIAIPGYMCSTLHTPNIQIYNILPQETFCFKINPILFTKSFCNSMLKIMRCFFCRALISRFDIWVQINFFLWQIYMLFYFFIWYYLLSGCYLGAKVSILLLEQPSNLLLLIRVVRDIKSQLTYLKHSNFIHILSAVNLIPQHFLG